MLGQQQPQAVLRVGVGGIGLRGGAHLADRGVEIAFLTTVSCRS